VPGHWLLLCAQLLTCESTGDFCVPNHLQKYGLPIKRELWP
jgi:hypothetical protein